MKNKFLAIAASAAALGAAMVSAPAQAQTTTGPAPVGVSVTLPEILYLRTVQSIDVKISAEDLGAPAGALTDLSGTGDGPLVGRETSADTADGTNGVSLLSPFAAGATANSVQATKTIPQVYAIWSNTASAQGITVTLGTNTTTLNGSNGGTAEITDVLTDINGSGPLAEVTGVAAPGLFTPIIGNAILQIELGGTQTAGEYTGGEITVEASIP